MIKLTAAQFRRLADIKDEIAELESEFNTIVTTGTPVSMPEPKRKISGWTTERTAKFKRTMRLKREGKL